MNTKRFLGNFLMLVILTLNELNMCICGNQLRKYQIIPGQRVTAGGTEIARVSKPGLTSLRCAALCSSDCGLFQFSRDLELCVTFAQRLYEVALTFDLQSEIGYKPINSELKYRMDPDGGEWTLVFRLQKETSNSAYQTWTEHGRHDDNPVDASYPLACVSLYNYSSCDRHFRSHILDNWAGISEVYLSVIKNEEQVAFIKFDGIGSNYLSWFNETRITDSTWFPNVTRSWELSEHTGILGFCTEYACRRFYLFAKHTACESEWFYFMVFDYESDSCHRDGRWVKPIPNNPPSIVYSPTPGFATFAADLDAPSGQYADAMAVYVKFA